MSTARQIGSWTHAEEDNNCAFNAFILGLSGLVIEGKLTDANATPELKQLLAKIQEAGLITAPTVAAFKIYIENETPFNIQKSLQHIFRVFTVDEVLKKDPTNVAQNAGLIHHLQSQFLNFIKNKRTNGKHAITDDVFTIPYSNPKKYLPVIEQQFEEIYLAHQKRFDAVRNSKELNQLVEDLKVVNPTLSTWWQVDGSSSFLNDYMKKSGSWAGDLELVPLAKKLGIGLKVYSRDALVGDLDYGTLKIDDGIEAGNALSRLSRCSYVSGYYKDEETKLWDSSNLKWSKPVSTQDLTAALGDVDQLKQVEQFFTVNKTNLKTKVVPAEWSEKCKNQLAIRNVIRKAADGNYGFAINEMKDMSALKAVPMAEQVAVLAAFKQNPPKEKVHVSLTNVGKHWNNRKAPHIVKPAITVPAASSPVSSVVAQPITKIVADIAEINAKRAAEAYEQGIKNRKILVNPTDDQPKVVEAKKENVRTLINDLFKAKEEGRLDPNKTETKVMRKVAGESDSDFTTREKQILTDEKLAKELQAKELARATTPRLSDAELRAREKQSLLDEQLARKLQEESEPPRKLGPK